MMQLLTLPARAGLGLLLAVQFAADPVSAASFPPPDLRTTTSGDGFVGMAPDDAPPARPGAASHLWQLVASLKDWRAQSLVLAQLSTDEHSRLDAAIAALQQARRDYGRDQSMSRIYAHLQQADSRLAGIAPAGTHPRHAEVRAFRTRVGQVAQRMAVQLFKTAEQGGAQRADLAIWQAQLAAADSALRRGDFQPAVVQHQQVGAVISAGLYFDVEAFEQEIRDALQGDTVGYSYAIVRNGLLHAADGEGLARQPGTAQSAYKPMYIASLSKTISTLALLRTLQNLGISLDESISPHLPSYWTQHGTVGAITFRHLLSHRSGLDVSATGVNLGQSGGIGGQSVATLRALIAAGIDTDWLLAEGEETPYVNANFALIRVLVPRLTLGEAFLTGLMDPAKSNEDAVYSAYFSQLASAYVLEPTGMPATACGPREILQTQTLYYSILNNDEGDLRDHAIGGNFQRICGATGFYLSAVEVAGVLAYRRHSNAIINATMRAEMDASFLGWLQPEAFGDFFMGTFGTYRAHGGDSAVDGTTPGVAGCMMDFPIHLQAVLLINSRGGPGGAASCGLLRDAYDAAWVYP